MDNNESWASLTQVSSGKVKTVSQNVHGNTIIRLTLTKIPTGHFGKEKQSAVIHCRNRTK